MATRPATIEWPDANAFNGWVRNSIRLNPSTSSSLYLHVYHRCVLLTNTVGNVLIGRRHPSYSIFDRVLDIQIPQISST